MAVFDWLQQLLGGGQYGDPSTPAMPTEPLGQGQGYTADVLQHLKDVIGGKVAAGGALAQNNYAPRQSFAQNALNPAGIEAATDVAFGIGPGAIRAYHGSPHSFDKFDLSKIGTGEGAQAYGHGLYFAEAEDVARGYRDTLAGKAPLREYGGQPLETNRDWYSLIDKVEPQDWRLARIIDAAGKQGGVRSALDTFEPHTRNASDGPQWAAAIERFKEGVGPAAKGHMYEVNIHADPKAFLDWDRALTAQPAGVQKALKDAWLAHPDAHANQTGQQIYEEAAKQRNPEFEAAWGSPDLSYPSASSLMKEAGIPGIRYLDQGSRGAGTGTSNYAVFDDKLIEILRKYGILPPLAAGGLLGAAEE